MRIFAFLIAIFGIMCQLLASQAATLQGSDQRIVGGYTVDIGKVGYQISLRKKSLFDPQDPYTHICGGTIYSENIVITAAHCIIATVPSQLKVIAGANIIIGNDGVMVGVQEIIMHEYFDPETFDNDIAILVLNTPLPLNGFRIRKLDLIDSNPRGGVESTITGWGTLFENGFLPYELQEVKVPIVSNDECNIDYEGAITERMLCAGLRGVGGKDACQGDSGGPLVVRGKLAGVVSWGAGCARAEYPGVYANVWTLQPWLMEKINQIEL